MENKFSIYHLNLEPVVLGIGELENYGFNEIQLSQFFAISKDFPINFVLALCFLYYQFPDFVLSLVHLQQVQTFVLLWLRE